MVGMPSVALPLKKGKKYSNHNCLADAMVGRTGATLQILARESPGEVRYSTIQCGLRRTLKHIYDDLLCHFKEVSHILGQYDYVVGLASNWLLINNPQRIIEDWKQFYDQVFSAVDKSSGPFAKEIALFKDEMNITLPNKVPFDLRQEEAKEMEQGALLHMKRFPCRLKSYMKHRFVDLQIERIGLVILCDGVDQDIYDALVHCLTHNTKPFIVLKKQYTGLEKENEATQEVVNALAAEVVADELLVLNDKFFARSKCSDKELYRYLPHLQRYANWNLEWMIRYKEEKLKRWTCSTTPKSFSLLPIMKLQPRLVHYTWTQFETFLKSWVKNNVSNRLSKALNKIDKLEEQRQGFVTPKNAYPWKKKVKDKDKLDKEKLRYALSAIREYKKDRRQQTILSCVKRFKAAGRRLRERQLQEKKQYCQLQLMTDLFDIKYHVKGKSALNTNGIPEWRLVDFRTDGVQLCLTFASTSKPTAPNTQCLVEAGYNIPVPSEKIDVMEEERGIYQLKENRNDLQPINSNKDKVVIVPIDPGGCKTIFKLQACLFLNVIMLKASVSILPITKAVYGILRIKNGRTAQVGRALKGWKHRCVKTTLSFVPHTQLYAAPLRRLPQYLISSSTVRRYLKTLIPWLGIWLL